MLRRSRIALTMLIAGITTVGNAAFVNSDGFGQIALLPYYNVNNNIITSINIINTTGLFKAVKVRFRDSLISADVFDVNLYLSPYDVWNGTIRLNPATGLPNFITEDESCTFPDKALLQAGVDFNNNYDAISDDDLTEGYVEIIEMGVIADGPGSSSATDDNKYAEIDATGIADGVITDGDRSIAAGLLHDANGIPADCSVVEDAWSAGQVDANINGFEPGGLTAEGIAASSATNDPYDSTLNAGLVYEATDRGGITAYAIMINAASGAAFVEPGTHIDDYATLPQHYRSNDSSYYLLPSLASGDVTQAHMLNNSRGVKSTGPLSLTEWDTGAVNDIAPNPSVPMGSNPFPIAVALSADVIAAPYFTEAGINGGTEIVATFPMRKHGIYNGTVLTDQIDREVVACDGDIDDGIDDGAAVTIPNTGITAQDYPVIAGVYCENGGLVESAPDVEVSLYYYDYDERAASLTLEETWDWILPPVDYLDAYTLERAVNVVKTHRSDGTSASVLGTPVANIFYWQLDEGFEAGWVQIDMSRYDYNNDVRIINLTEAVGGINGDGFGYWTGVPVIGFAVMAADVGPAQIGETVDLIRFVNRKSPTL
ncbi:MAG: hypothetical protein ABW109_06410 [Candidatus Thiodiazotropha sp. 6PLUC4]